MKLSIKPLLISYLIIVIAVTAGMLAFGDTYSFYITREDTATDEVTFETDPVEVTIAAAPVLDGTTGSLDDFENWCRYDVIELKYSLKEGWKKSPGTSRGVS